MNVGGTLPAGWRWTTMGEIADVVGGGTPRTSDPENFEGGSIAWLTPADLSGYSEKYVSRGNRFITERGLESSSARLLPEGAVMFTSRAPIGYVAIARNPISTNQGFKSFVLKPGVLPDYVYWWLKGAKQLAESMASGTTFLELSGAKAKQLPIPIAPIEDQRRIVAEIEKQFSRLDEAVANLKRVKANIKRYKAAVLKAAVEGRLVPTEAELARREGRSYETGAQLLQRILETRRSQWKGRGKYKEPAAPDTTDLPELPEGWVWVTVAHLLCQPIINGLSIKGSDTPPGIAALKLNAMSDKGFDYEHIRYLPLTTDKVADILVREGDFFVSRGNGSLDLVGRGTIAQSSKFEVIFPDTMMRLRLQPVAIDTNWLPIIWPSRWIRQQIEQRVKTTAGIYKIAQPQMASIIVPLPPLAEQHRIVAEIDRLFTIIRELECTTEKEVCRAVVLKSAVMHAAFSLPAASNVGVD